MHEVYLNEFQINKKELRNKRNAKYIFCTKNIVFH